MTFNPHLPIVWLVIIILIASVATIASIWFSQKLKNSRYKFAIIFLRIAALCLLFLILLNPIKVKKTKLREQANKDILLIDASSSMSLESPESRLSQLKSVVNDLSETNKQNLVYYSFDTLAKKIKTDKTISDLKADGGISNLSTSIENIINAEDPERIRNLIVCSDGQITDKNKLEQAIALARTHEIPISVLGIGKPTELFNTAIKECRTIRHTGTNTKVSVKVFIETKGSNNESYELTLKDSKDNIIDTKYGYLKDGIIQHNMQLTTGLDTKKYHLEIKPIAGELTIEDNNWQFKIEVSNPKIRVLYMEGTIVDYAHATGRWPAYKFIHEACRKTGRIEMDTYVVDVQQPVGGELFHVSNGKKGYPKTKEALSKYDVIICSDINRFVFNDSQLEWTRDLISNNGTGFCMIGGDTSFGQGGYDKTVWEQMIPVDMKTFNKTIDWGRINVIIPEKSKTHPIWKISNNREQNNYILENHPSFHGTNAVNRAKPGATVLAYMNGYNNMPLICVQSYGKGRSMAFTSDAAGGWGIGYQDRWSADRRSNKYYEKFWANTVLWLAENSQANKQKKLISYTDKLSYYPTDTINVEAEVSIKDKNIKIESHFLDTKKAKTKLKYSSAKKTFGSSILIPENTTKKELILVTNAFNKVGEEIATDTLSIPIKRVSAEYKNTNPDFKTLEQLMVLTGGKNIQSANDLNNLLNNKTQAKSKLEETQRIPAWDRWWFWALIVLILSSEWVLRKFYA